MWHPSFPTEGLNQLGTEANRQRTEEQNASLLVAEVTLGGNAQWKSHDELASFSSLGLGGARLRENLDARKRHFSTPLLPTGPRGDGRGDKTTAVRGLFRHRSDWLVLHPRSPLRLWGEEQAFRTATLMPPSPSSSLNRMMHNENENSNSCESLESGRVHLT